MRHFHWCVNPSHEAGEHAHDCQSSHHDDDEPGIRPAAGHDDHVVYLPDGLNYRATRKLDGEDWLGNAVAFCAANDICADVAGEALGANRKFEGPREHLGCAIYLCTSTLRI